MLSIDQARALPISEESETDVVVVGSVTGASMSWAAACCAVRNGAKTILIEDSHQPGGMITAGLELTFGSMCTYSRKRGAFRVTDTLGKQVVGGIAAEFADRLKTEGGAWGIPGTYTEALLQDDELAKYVIDQMLLEDGVDIWYLSQFVDAIMEGNKLRGVVVVSKAGLRIIWCKVGIDSSDDGDVAVKAGAGWEMGRPIDGRCQPANFYFILGGHEIGRTLQYVRSNPDDMDKGSHTAMSVEEIEKCIANGEPWRSPQGFHSLRKQALAKGEFPVPYGSDRPHPTVTGWRSTFASGRTMNDRVSLNIGDGYGINFTDRRQYSQFLPHLRKFVVQMSRFYCKYIPGFEHSYLTKIGVIPHVRESRRITGEYVLTHDDVLNCRPFDDTICRISMYLDVHPEAIGESQEQRGNPARGQETLRGDWANLPYRCLVPKGVDGILVIGGRVSVDHWAQGSIRNTFCGIAMGHAAGVAAAMAVKDDTSVRDIQIKALLGTLREQGALL